MPLEKLFVETHALQAHGFFTGHKVSDPIDQGEGIAMGQEIVNFWQVEGGFGRSGSGDNALNDRLGVDSQGLDYIDSEQATSQHIRIFASPGLSSDLEIPSVRHPGSQHCSGQPIQILPDSQPLALKEEK